MPWRPASFVIPYPIMLENPEMTIDVWEGGNGAKISTSQSEAAVLKNAHEIEESHTLLRFEPGVPAAARRRCQSSGATERELRSDSRDEEDAAGEETRLEETKKGAADDELFPRRL